MQWRTGEVLSLTRRMWRWLVFAKNRECAKCAPVFWYNMRRQKHSCFDRLKRNLEISFVRVGKEEDAPFWGRVPFRVSYRAFPGPLLKRGRGLRPLSFPAKQNKGKRKKGRERWERQAQEVRVVRPTHLPFMAVSFWAKWERRGLCHTHTMNMLMRRMKIGIALLQQVGGFADITVPSRIIAIG